MKNSPDNQRLETLLRSSALVAGGFMGDDERSVFEMMDADATVLALLDRTKEQIASRMRQITEQAIPGLGTWVKIEDRLEARVDEARGRLVCPWPHAGRFAKRITSLKVLQTGQVIRWSDLSIHFIGEHGFFEGKGSSFRIEPEELVRIVFNDY